ncbi:MAG TPA: ABC transporter permease [Terracidiphilus sp.]|jgi:predicted permease|nr:ABC transporter permease [Terracidiphilus sp.]
MNQLLQDIRYAIRQLRKSPGFAVTAIVTLALGIGANTAIFTLVHGILLRTLPVSDPKLLWRIGDNEDCCVEGGFPGGATDTGDFTIFSTDLYQYLRANTPEFKSLAAMQAGQWQWAVRRGNAIPKDMHGEFVSGNYFTTLGIGPWSGRIFSESDDTPSSTPTAVLSYKAWQGEYNSDPSIIGSTIFIQTHPVTVIGVAPPGFFGDRVSDNPPDFWLPIQIEPYLRGTSSILKHGDSHWLYLVGRLPADQSIPALQSKIGNSLRQWLWTRTVLIQNGGGSVIPKMHVVLTPGGGGIQSLQDYSGAGLKMLMILSSIVLLIACANIANLLLARATTRRSEIAVRMAIGAARRHLIGQIVTESVILSCIGGVAGLVVAYAGCHAILALAFPDAHNMPVDPSPSPIILGFAFLVSLLTGILFSTGPAWLSSHAQPAEALRGVNRSTKDRSSLPQKSLVVFQAALSVVLLCGAVLMTRTLNALENQNFGVVTSNRYVVHFDPVGAGYTTERMPQLYRQIEDRFSTLPGVRTMSLAMYSPLEGDNWGECVIQQGHPAPRPGDKCGSTWVRVSTHYLDSIGVPIVRGRNFSEQDTASSPQVVLVNETFAKHFFPNQNPVGQHFGIDFPQYSGAWQIVGVFRDFKMNNPRDEVHNVYLRPLTQQFTAYTQPEMTTGEVQSMNMNALILDFNVPPSNVDSLVRTTLASVDPNLTVSDLRSFGAQVAGNFDQERLVARLTTLFGVLALILACVGLYGVMSYFVARRTGEIGIRMALGATRGSVMSLVLRGALWQILIGLVLGIPASLYAGYLMKSILYGVGSYDPWALVGAPLMLVVCATFAGLLPARRAASIEPMRALRIE